jgi:hypothetical protein
LECLFKGIGLLKRTTIRPVSGILDTGYDAKMISEKRKLIDIGL